jgi:hypothetical protein
MATSITTAPSLTSVVVHPQTDAGKHYREGRKAGARARGFPARPGLNLRYFGGRTIEHLTWTTVYLGGKAAWQPDDSRRIDHALAAAMQDGRLNNVLAQYFADGKPTSVFKPSRVLEGPLPPRVFRDTLEGFVAGLDRTNALSGFKLDSSVFCFCLPRGVVLVDGESGGGARNRDDEHSKNVVFREQDEAVDSKHGLGGYHGSIHAARGSKKDTVYYAVAVYAEGANGIPAFPEPWQSICATLYHELCEARTDPDVEDAIRAGNDPSANDFLGWYSPRGGEIGDIPMDEAGADLGLVMKEVPLADGSGKVPVQLMWSNAVGGPEGPVAQGHSPARRAARS